MILNLKEELKRNILLSEFDLSYNDYDRNQFSIFFKNKILSDIRLNSKFTNIYLNYFVFTTKSGSGKDFYKQLNNNIQLEISKQDHPIEYNNKHNRYVYSRIRISSDDKDINKYIILYLSSKANNYTFDINQYYNASNNDNKFIDYLLYGIISLTLNCLIIEDESKKINICEELFSGDLLINTLRYKNNISGFKTKIFIKDKILTFRSSIEEYSIAQKDLLSTNGTVLSTKGDLLKLDARKSKRKFINFNDDKYLTSKYSTNLYIYDKLTKVFEILGLHFEASSFAPNFIFNDFLQVNDFSKSSELHIMISQKDQCILENNDPNELEYIIKYIRETFKKEPQVVVFDDQSLPQLDNSHQYLFLMARLKTENEKLIVYNQMSNLLQWSNTKSLFADIVKNDGILDENSLDPYTRIKLDNLKKIEKGNCRPTATQGLIISYTINDKNDIKIDKANTHQIYKSLSDLYIKDQLFNRSTIELSKCEFNNIKILKHENIQTNLIEKNKDNDLLSMKKTKDLLSFYSFVELCRREDLDNSSLFEVKEFLLEHTYDKDQIPEGIVEKFHAQRADKSKYSDFDSYMILIDDLYLLRICDKIETPSIISDQSIFISERNPNKLITNAINDGTLQRLKKAKEDAINDAKAQGLKRAKRGEVIISRTTDMSKNLFYPFVMPKFIKAFDVEKHEDYKMSNLESSLAIINIQNNISSIFVNQSEDPLKAEIDKSNLIEKIAIFLKNENGIYRECKHDDVIKISNFYLQCMTYNLISNKSVAKKTLLTKLSDIILEN